METIIAHAGLVAEAVTTHAMHVAELLGPDGVVSAKAFGATALIGVAPILLLYFVPQRWSKDKGILKILLGFALGGLAGDALLHLLPHSVGHDHGHGHDHHDHHDDHHHHEHDHGHGIEELEPWLWTLCGILAFFLMDKIVRSRLSDGGHQHSHQHHAHVSSAAKKEKDAKEEGARHWSPSGFLNLIADFFHNFTDGLALGSTFRTGSGLQTTVAILLHEIPHEIGDYAVLVDSGFTKTEAMKAQVVTALGAMAGCGVGLMWGDTMGSDAWIQPFTAGGFLYIALATIIPSLLEESTLVQTLLEVAGMLVGVGSMVYIALYLE